jgi:hypothetical protein
MGLTHQKTDDLAFKEVKLSMKPVVSYPSFHLTQNERKGYLFEKWVVNQFPDKDFLLREWRSDKHIGRRAADSGMNPDLIFQCRETSPNLYFAIECKYKNYINDEIPQWAEEYQLKNYQEFQDKYNMSVFLALGIGGSAFQPQSFSIIPLSVLNNSILVSKAVREEYKRCDLPFSKNTFLPQFESGFDNSIKADPTYIPTWLTKTD